MKPESRHAVHRALRLGVRAADDVRRLHEGRLETEGRTHELEVVVDRLRHAHDGDREAARKAHLRDVARAAQRAVAADAEEHVDVHAHQRLHDVLGGLLPARAAEDRAADLVDRVHLVGPQQKRLLVAARREARVAVADAVDGLHAVVEGQDLDEALDHVVEAGAQPARREDRNARPGRVVEDPLVRTRPLEARLVPQPLLQEAQQRHAFVHVHAAPLGEERMVAHGRGDLARPQRVHVERVGRRVRGNLLKCWRHEVLGFRLQGGSGREGKGVRRRP